MFLNNDNDNYNNYSLLQLALDVALGWNLGGLQMGLAFFNTSGHLSISPRFLLRLLGYE